MSEAFGVIVAGAGFCHDDTERTPAQADDLRPGRNAATVLLHDLLGRT